MLETSLHAANAGDPWPLGGPSLSFLQLIVINICTWMENASSAAGAPVLVVGFAAYGLLLAVVSVLATRVPTVDCA